MAMKIRHEGKEKTVDLEKDVTVAEALKKAGINKETVIVRKGKEIITDDEIVSNEDEIEAIRVISGG